MILEKSIENITFFISYVEKWLALIIENFIYLITASYFKVAIIKSKSAWYND